MWSAGQVPRFVTAMLVLASAVPASATAQSWEVEFHGGYVLSSKPSSGTGALPGTNAASASTVPSWYFGDGALVLNQALTSIRLSPSIVALDSVLKSPFVERRPGGSVGIRIGRVPDPTVHCGVHAR